MNRRRLGLDPRSWPSDIGPRSDISVTGAVVAGSPAIGTPPDQIAPEASRIARLDQDYPWLFAPRDALAYVAQNAAVTVAAAATVTLLSLSNLLGGQTQIPSGQRGQMWRFANDASDLTAISWTVQVRGVPRPPIAGISFQWAPLTAPVLLLSPGIRLEPNDDLIVTANNTSANPVTGVRCRVELLLWQMRR